MFGMTSGNVTLAVPVVMIFLFGSTPQQEGRRDRQNVSVQTNAGLAFRLSLIGDRGTVIHYLQSRAQTPIS